MHFDEHFKRDNKLVLFYLIIITIKYLKELFLPFIQKYTQFLFKNKFIKNTLLMVFIWKAYAEIPLHINIYSKEKLRAIFGTQFVIVLLKMELMLYENGVYAI